MANAFFDTAASERDRETLARIFQGVLLIELNPASSRVDASLTGWCFRDDRSVELRLVLRSVTGERARSTRPVEAAVARPLDGAPPAAPDDEAERIAAQMYAHHGLDAGSSTVDWLTTCYLVSGFLQAGFSREVLLTASRDLGVRGRVSASTLNDRLGDAVTRQLSADQWRSPRRAAAAPASPPAPPAAAMRAPAVPAPAVPAPAVPVATGQPATPPSASDDAVERIVSQLYAHHGLETPGSEVDWLTTRYTVSGFLQAGFSPEVLMVASRGLREQRLESAAELNDKLGEAVSRELTYGSEPRSRGSSGSVEAPVGSVTRGKAGIEWVSLGTFELSKTEVTVAQYRACVEAGACSEPFTSSHCNWGRSGRDNHPVNCVSWTQAAAFASWAGGRLPTGEEWTYAATSGGQLWKYPWGSNRATCERAIMDDGGNGCGQGHTWPVCSKPFGESMQGLCDLAGNVWEWTDERTASNRVGRGGSWSSPASSMGVSRRYRGDHSWRYSDLGIRLAR